LESSWFVLGSKMLSKEEQTTRLYEFGPFCADAGERVLRRAGEPLPLAPKLFETLLVLVKNSGRIVEKSELMEAVWPETFVEESNLTANISLLRKILGARDDGKGYIETVARRGYRFAGEVTESENGGEEILLRRRTRTRIIATEEDDETPALLVGADSARKEIEDRYQPARELSTDLPSLQLLPSSLRSEVKAPQQVSSVQVILNELRRHKKTSVLALVGLFLVIAGAVFAWQKFADLKAAAPARTMKITRLTTGGRVNNTVIAGSTSISADGKFVVFALTEAGRQSLWTRQVLTGSDVQIVAPAEGGILGTTISRDNEFVYYVWGDHYVWDDKDSPRDTLFQVPVFGGTPRKVLTGVNSPVTFSPDGHRFAFLRNLRDQGGVSLMVANADGSGERTLATRTGYDFFYSAGPSWSPDGKVIACAAGTLKGGLSTTVVEVPAEGGSEKPLTSQKWPLKLHRVIWLGDGTGLILSADIQGTSGTQLWFISYPEGKARRITNDLNGYGTFSLGLTADNSTIVTVLDDPSMQIWTTAVSGPPSLPSQISHGKIDGARGLDWMPDGKIVYVTEGTDNTELRIMNADGTDSRPLTSDPYIKDYPAVSPDGNYVFFATRKSGTPDVWRINVDGSNLKQITSGESADYAPTCSPDGQWITFTSTRSGTNGLWKVSVDGGEPVLLTDRPATRGSFSPDGKLIACGYFVEGAKQPWKIALIPFAGGPPVKLFEMPQSVNFWAGLWWTPDARAFFYTDTRNGVSNIWSQPVDGGKAVQITNFDTETILHFARSRDGKNLALSRGHPTADVVLIKDFK